jgi:hypothetical protein
MDEEIRMATTGKRIGQDAPKLVRRQSVAQSLPEPLAPVPEYDREPTPDDERKRERSSPLDMLFREAEVIAQNLKESGTRR